ncbi:MAG: formate/nitrite transporter family protein [Treponema sp.]|jgi:formate/nitrite transporter|nr:formate/nitrite transporter family protein [Treponema sp.]
MENRTPAEILAYTSDTGCAKTQRKISAVLILSFLAGAFISFASLGTNAMAYNLLANPNTFGLGRALAGAGFGTGLMLVSLGGGELFTGNMLIIVSVLERRVKVRRMLLNWLLVYLGNFAGCLCLVFMVHHSGLFNSADGMLGGVMIKTAVNKTSLPFHSAFFLGVMCNWLVCMAVWVSSGARDITGKILAIFFIVGLFVVSGFEHSVANMYYIPAGILAKQNSLWQALSGSSTAELSRLNWTHFFTKNLIPVTLGNIAGGSIMVGVLYWFSLGKAKPREEM